MLQIEFELRAEGDELPDAFLDASELEMMFAGTRTSLGDSLRRKFAAVKCGEHGSPPKFTISGAYDRATEQMDLQYHVDTCCQAFLLRVMQILNQRV
ncbi:MAG: hypothetical protein OXG92_01960 [Chloroflexi bacterium]|nr:hypothetical protein [Chloroflexota bacterium]MCY3581028.1 hypothetical protein [Chloroflexota bacterium]MCY3715217.1 hypothetical protein [Chloroflexota bacterium]MDE2649988.1 hypothetical protein [Chloroflexota bacterium]MXV94138.1 hypothetical protein [Chloroflexota bacterium]